MRPYFPSINFEFNIVHGFTLCLSVPWCYLGSDGTYLDNQALKRLYDLQDYSDFLRYALFLYTFL